MGEHAPELDVAALSPATLGASVVAELVAGEDGQIKLERRIRTRAGDEPGGKLSKREVYYSPVGPPPALWEYHCDTCRFYNGDPDSSGTCDVVGREGDPMGGEAVHGDAWCALWLPEADSEPFEWLKERVTGPT